jgi:Holliday junction DNA helicase RuvB
MKEVMINLAEGAVLKPNLSYFNGFIGQASAIKKLMFFAQSNSLDTPFPTLLFTGSHGLGKTFLAEMVAKTLGRKFISVNCGSLKRKDDFISDVVCRINSPTTIFLDESHNLSRDITTVLLTLLNPTNNHVNSFRHKGVEILYDLRLINIIFATTDAHAMFKPLRNRCFPIYFSPYGQEELIEILNHYLDGIAIDCDLDDISEACRSRARDAFLLSQNIKRYISFSDVKAIGEKEWNDIKDTFEIYPRGLNKEEVNLLTIIRDSGPISCANLALRLMVNEENIKSELEVRLRELGMIENTTKGRVITDEGLDFFKMSESCDDSRRDN